MSELGDSFIEYTVEKKKIEKNVVEGGGVNRETDLTFTKEFIAKGKKKNSPDGDNEENKKD